MSWKLKDKIEKIVNSHCREVPWEGTEIDKHGIIEAVYALIMEDYVPAKKEQEEEF